MGTVSGSLDSPSPGDTKTDVQRRVNNEPADDWWDGGYMLGHAIPLTPHPHDLPQDETQQIMDDIKQREARRIPLGFAIPKPRRKRKR